MSFWVCPFNLCIANLSNTSLKIHDNGIFGQGTLQLPRSSRKPSHCRQLSWARIHKYNYFVHPVRRPLTSPMTWNSVIARRSYIPPISRPSNTAYLPWNSNNEGGDREHGTHRFGDVHCDCYSPDCLDRSGRIVIVGESLRWSILCFTKWVWIRTWHDVDWPQGTPRVDSLTYISMFPFVIAGYVQSIITGGT